MRPTRLDALCRLFASRSTRRGVVAGGLGLASAAVGTRAIAQNGTPAATPSIDPSDPHPSADETAPEPEFLFVQSFDSGTWLPKEGEDGVYTLTLAGAAAQTVYFSDRPERIVGLAPTQQFLDGLGFTPANPPNAALVAQRLVGTEQEVLVIELLNPIYDAAAETLTYDARVLADYGEHGLAHLARQQQDYEVGEAFGAGSLFIDDCDSHKARCYLKTDGSEVGIVEVRYCFDWNSLSCEPCKHPDHYCKKDIFECQGVDGTNLCMTE